jgi:DNA invertase Pin-like site-specific DNA recombinase
MQKQTETTEIMNLDNQTHLSDKPDTPLSFQQVASSAPLKDDFLSIVRDNEDPFVSRPRKGKQSVEGITALYVRLSNDDKTDGESNSIATQKKILERYCKEHSYTSLRYYVDDGVSGVTFEREGFQAMLADIKAGIISRVLVKDMSRFGRDYLQVGMFTDVLFPSLGVHFIAVNDSVDSKRGDNEFAAIRNIFNEMYARDTSKKIRATWQNKGRSDHLTVHPPYGYITDPDNPKHWIVDEPSAAIVQQIFSFCMEGLGTTQIADHLREQKVLCPTAYRIDSGRSSPHKSTKGPYNWTAQTISNTLRRLEYLGHTVNFRTTKESYKSDKLLYNSPDDWVIIENTQEPIIDANIYWTVQSIRQGRRRRPTLTGEPDTFAGLMFCPDCGNRMYRTKKYTGRDTHFYSCATYHSSHREARECSVHYIGNLALEEIVLRNLREAIAYVSQYENEFIRELADISLTDKDRELAKSRGELIKVETRITEIDEIIKRLYEDNIIGKLTDERFIKLSGDYEHEQDVLRSETAVLSRDIKEREKRKANANNFVTITRKYTDLQELNAAMLIEFIERIYVYEKDKQSKQQEVKIVYNFIGAFDFLRSTNQI